MYIHFPHSPIIYHPHPQGVFLKGFQLTRPSSSFSSSSSGRRYTPLIKWDSIDCVYYVHIDIYIYIDSMLLCVNTKDRWVLICHRLSSLLALLQFPIFWRCSICATYFQVGITSYQNRDHEMQAKTKQDHLGLRTHRSLSPCELTSCEAGSDPKYILVDFHSGKSDCQRPQTAKAYKSIGF